MPIQFPMRALRPDAQHLQPENGLDSQLSRLHGTDPRPGEVDPTAQLDQVKATASAIYAHRPRTCSESLSSSCTRESPRSG